MGTPNLIELDEAVSRIKQACESTGTRRPPFFFMVGAGISSPSVPLASEIVAECKQIADKYGRTSEPRIKSPIDVYSHWFETAYGEPIQRQQYLRALIESKQITHANFRLAHLLLDKPIANIVVTTNFDDFLTKALTLFGKRHIVCDHPLTVGRINPTISEIQIVHVHGTHWFYDCCNLRGEVRDRAQQSAATTTSMASLLDMILWDRAPIVVGYSGWEGDVFMESLKRRIARPLGTNAYWFCFQRSSVDSLPEWLRTHPNIRFVVPPLISDSSATDVTTSALPEKDENFEKQSKGKPFGLEESIRASLPADNVFDSLIRAFNSKAPLLTNDPLSFFAGMLDESLPKEEASNKEADIYAIRNVIERVRKAKQREIEEALASPDSRLEVIRDALRRADYRAAIQLATQVQLEGFNRDQLSELAAAAWTSATKLNDNSADEVSAYDVFVQISDRITAANPILKSVNDEKAAEALFNKGFVLAALNRIDEGIAVYDDLLRLFGNAPKTTKLREQVAKALLSKGFRLGEMNRADEAIAIYDDLVQRFGDAPETASLREQVAKALCNKGIELGEMNRRDEAISVYDDVVQRFGDAPEPSLREQVAKALFNKGVTLGIMDRSDEAISVYDEVVQRIGDAQDSNLREKVARALFNKAFRLGKLNRSDEGIAVYDHVVQQFGDAPESILREQVARALVNKGIAFGELNRSDEAIAVYDDVVTRFGDEPESALREQVAKALVNKGLRFGALNRSDEAIAAYDDVVKRFGDAPEAELQRLVTQALNGTGFRLLIAAKGLMLINEERLASEKLKQADKTLTSALEREPDSAMILGNKAYLAFLSGKKGECAELLRRAISLGGETIRRAELHDANINRLPADDEFCEMVRAIPASPSEVNKTALD